MKQAERAFIIRVFAALLAVGPGGLAWAVDGGTPDASVADGGTSSPAQPGDGGMFDGRMILVPEGNAAKSVRLTVVPENLPPSVTKASFDRLSQSADGSDYAGDHLEVSWDPSLNAPLAKAVVLRPGNWQVSFFAQPLQHPADPYADTSWSFFEFCKDNNCAPKNQVPGRLLACAYRRTRTEAELLSTPPCTKDVPATMGGWTVSRIWVQVEPSLLTPQQLMARFGERGESTTPLPSSARSFSEGATQASADLLNTVADVAIERLEQAALDEIRGQLLDVLCRSDEKPEARNRLIAEKLGRLPLPLHLAFPRTCATLQRVRLQELTAAGSGLHQAIKQDVASFGALLLERTMHACLSGETKLTWCPEFVRSQPELAAVVGGLVLLMKLSTDPDSSPASLAQAQLMVKQLVDALHQGRTSNVLKDQSNVFKGALVLAGAGIAYCHAHGPCDSHTLRRFLDHPEQFLEIKDPLLQSALKNEKYIALKGRLLSILTQAQSVMSPESRQDSRRAAQEGAAVAFEMLELVIDAQCFDQTSHCEGLRDYTSTLRKVSHAVLQQDPSVALVAAGGVVLLYLGEHEKPRFELQVRYASALTNYLSSYPSLSSLGAQGAQLSIEEQRRLRRQAIHALVDLASDRTQHVGKCTVALTVTPGARGFWSSRGQGVVSMTDMEGQESEVPKPEYSQHVGTQLALQIGVSVEYIYTEKIGFFAQGTLFDLGQYAGFSFDSKRTTQLDDPLTAVALGGGVGFHYKGWAAILDARYSPGWHMKGKEQNADLTVSSPFSLGVTLGYQIPLFRIR
jgi:hypothetical protein